MSKVLFYLSFINAILLFGVGETQAQASIGLKGGLNMSSLNGLDPVNFDSKYKTGYHLGAFANIHFGKKLSIQPELIYSTQGGSIDNGLQVQDIEMDYFNVPVMLRYSGSAGFYLEAGPQFGFSSGEVDWKDLDGSMKKSDLSICGGIGYLGSLLPVGAGLRYNYGIATSGEITNATEENSDFKNGVFQLSIYWRIFGK